MYKELKNTIIDKKDEKYIDFPDLLDGHLFIDFDNGFITQEIPKTIIPNSITMRQARLHLLDLELLDDIESFISQDRRWQIEWEYATEILRDSKLIEAVKLSLGLDDDVVNNMFIKASKL